MEIVEKYGLQQAPTALGQVVVIDVLRAFTTAAFAFAQGAKEIILVSDENDSFRLKEQNPEYILVGEKGGRIIEGFDFGNSPEAISQQNLTGKTVVLRSSSGTQNVVKAENAEKIYLGSLVVASATSKYLASIKKSPITILASGSLGGPDKDEDIACSNYMKSIIEGDELSKQEIIKRVETSPAGLQATDPTIDFKTPGDLSRAVEVNKFNFIMPVERKNGLLVATKEIVQ